MSLHAAPVRHVVVETRDHQGDVVDSINGVDTSYEQEVALAKDKFKQLIGDANARTSVSVSARMGGPYGYSSVSVNCSVTLTCNQDDDTIQEAKMAAFQEAFGFIDVAMPQCMALLNAQLEEHYRTED